MYWKDIRKGDSHGLLLIHENQRKTFKYLGTKCLGEFIHITSKDTIIKECYDYIYSFVSWEEDLLDGAVPITKEYYEFIKDLIINERDFNIDEYFHAEDYYIRKDEQNK